MSVEQGARKPDIGQRHRARRAAGWPRAPLLLLQSIVENIPDMIFVKDAAELRFVLFNKAGRIFSATRARSYRQERP